MNHCGAIGQSYCEHTSRWGAGAPKLKVGAHFVPLGGIPPAKPLRVFDLRTLNNAPSSPTVSVSWGCVSVDGEKQLSLTSPHILRRFALCTAYSEMLCVPHPSLKKLHDGLNVSPQKATRLCVPTENQQSTD